MGRYVFDLRYSMPVATALIVLGLALYTRLQTPLEVLQTMAVGGAIGFVIGWCFEKADQWMRSKLLPPKK